jgi:hypothetical protein
MCRTVACKTCGKTTWAGCGEHVDAVMAAVPRAARCTCGPRTASGKGMFGGLFGRRG